MMNEVDRIADLLERTHQSGAWVDVSTREVLRSLSAAEASSYPVDGAHSAWEITLHIGAWHDVVRRRLQGEVLDVSEEEDWPRPGEVTEAKWTATLDELDRVHQELVAAVRGLGPEQLGETVPGKPFTIYTMLHGVTQHDSYHGGQLVLLRKTLRR
jgi:uncharacterized damage-inducible protein DinB